MKTDLVDLLMGWSSPAAIPPRVPELDEVDVDLDQAATAAGPYCYDDAVVLQASQEWLKRVRDLSAKAGIEFKKCLEILNFLLTGTEADPSWNIIISYTMKMFGGRTKWGNVRGVDIHKLRVRMAIHVSQMLGCPVGKLMFENAINDSNVQSLD